ncbi:hypothetical protein GZH46_01809, partial [Fragariocoptes setiger]
QLGLSSRPLLIAPSSSSWAHQSSGIINNNDDDTPIHTETAHKHSTGAAMTTPAFTPTPSIRQRVHIEHNEDSTVNTHATIELKVTRFEHRARIGCRATHLVAPDKPLFKELELRVQHTPTVSMEPAQGIVFDEQRQRIVVEPSSSAVSRSLADNQTEPIDSEAVWSGRQSSQVIMYCTTISAYPAQLLSNSTRWFKDGVPLFTAATHTASRDTGVTSSTSGRRSASADDWHHQSNSNNKYRAFESPLGHPALSIANVSRADAGQYACQVRNARGPSDLGATRTVALDVQYRPRTRARLLALRSSGRSTDRLGSELEQPEQAELFLHLLASGANSVTLADAINASNSQLIIRPIDTRYDVLQDDERPVLACDIVEANPRHIHAYQWRRLVSPSVDHERHDDDDGHSHS